MQLQIYQVAAFTDSQIGGNPAAVVPLAEWIDDSPMRNIAAENNLSETAFFVPISDGEWPSLVYAGCRGATLRSRDACQRGGDSRAAQSRTMANPFAIRKWSAGCGSEW